MSRDGAQSKIDYLTNSILGNTNKQSRTALNNAVRYNAMLQLFDDREPAYNVPGSVERSRVRNSLAGLDPRRISDEQLATALDRSVQDLTEEFNSTVNPDDDNTIDTPQTKLTNRAFRTELGSITSNEISFNRGRFFEANSRNNLLQQGGAGYAFKGYMSSFSSGVDDVFGSRVLYDNVFGGFETGEKSLSERAKEIDPEDYAATSTQKVLQTLVNKNLLDSQASINKVDREFQNFFGKSMVAEASASGGGLVQARQILDYSIERSLQLRREESQIRTELGGTDPLEVAFNDRIQEIHKEIVALELDRKASLDYINVGYSSRRDAKDNATSTIVNKSGVREFVDLFNSAKNNITIQTYQFQNETIGASVRDVLKRRVLERIGNPSAETFKLNLVLAYPKQRVSPGDTPSKDDRYGIGGIGYSINGPNLIEALSMKQMEEDLISELKELGYSSQDIKNAFQVNIEYRDRKFHPKLYMTDTMAAVGTQNLTAPVGNSLNQAGSNFEQMYIVHNHFDSDADLAAYREGRKQGAIQSENSLKDSQLRSSLLYRQIKQASQYEREFIRAQKGGTVPALGMGRKDTNSKGYNVGFAGDIYSHLTNTLDYAYEQSGLVHGSSGATGFKNLKAKSDVSMFMILDGAFMLQLGDIAFSGKKGLKGEMGDEVYQPFDKQDKNVVKYRSYQNKLFDLLITNNANVVVDKKNYKSDVYDPIADKIEKQGSAELKRNFAKFGKNLGLMAGNNIFGSDIEAMDAYLRAQGFTKEAGFSASDRKQIMGMGSGNIRMARSPRQHAKGFGLVDYSQGNPELISYYQGSSNMGFYSLDAGDKTNTEIGVMFGKDELSRVKNQAVVFGYENELDLEMAKQAAQQAVFTSNQMKDFSLSEEQEIDELRNIQDRFYQTYNQLSTNTIENRYIDNIKNAPMWQSNVNSGALQIQKARLEDLKQNLGLSDTAFNIVERLGEDGGVKSLNITINTASILGDSEFTNGQTAGKKLTFEISVLNSPNDRRIINRNSPVDPRNGSMENPGMVYFVDKNKLIGNGIFVNDSGESVEVMGRHNYNDEFQFGSEAGTVTVKSGYSAYMSSIDITTQAFGQIIGEITMQRHVTDPLTRYNKIRKQGGEDRLLTDYLSVMLTGKKAHLKSNGESLDSLDLISKSLRMIEFDSLGGDIISKVLSKEVSAEQIRSLIPTSSVERGSESKIEALKTFINTFRIALADEEVNLFGNHASNSDVRNITLDSTKHLLEDRDVAKQFLDTYLIPNFKQLVKQSPELLGEIMKYADTNNYESIEQSNLSAKLSMVFEPFLQSAEDTTYGGQQGYYRTLMYGLSSHRDAPSADLMNDYDDGKNIGQARRYARLNALGYTPTTDIHKFLYRSIASGASSTGKTDASLNSELLQQGARQVGSAQNFDVLQSVGIGTKIDRSTYVSGFGDELTIDGEFRQTLKDQGLSDAAIENVEREMKLQYADQNREFMSITTMDSKGQSHTKGTDNMIFFTGSAKKISQLPQRIKNALGARPLYQYGVEAQKALQSMTDPSGEKSTTLSDVTSSYVTNYGKKTLDVLDSQIEYFTEQLKNTAEGTDANKEAVEKIQMYSMFKRDLSLKAVRKSTGQVDYQAGHLFKLGAIYTGKIKSVLSADQAAYVSRIKEDIDTLFSGELMKDETPQEREELKQEMIRSYVLRASLDNSGLGKMIAGNDRTKYNIALLQLSGTYTDTFLANPLQGTVYRNESAYNNMKFNKNINMSETPDLINHKDVIVAGQREGYMVTQQLSTKSSMMAEEADLKATANARQGERTLLREDDFIQEDSEGRYVQIREGKVIRSASEKRTVSTLRGEVDNTNFGPTSSTATKSTAAYGRKGEFSIDYIFASLERDGNFANNEYLNELIRLRSILPGGARRVEGTDSSALVKGVANFAGQAQTYYINPETGERVVMNTFQFLESQILDKFEDGQVGGSLAAMLKAENRSYAFTQKDKDGNIKGYTPLSSMVSGLYNANNFKSFVWSHGATILKETRGTGMVGNNFMLNELLGIGADGTKRNQVEIARKAASGLLISFGSSYLKGGQDAEFKKAIIQGLRTGSAGKNYQKLAGVLQLTKGVGGDDAVEYLFDEIIQKEDKKKGLFFSDANLAGLRGLDANDIKAVMSGDPNSEATIKASERFMAQIGGMLTSQASIISKQGYMEMSSFSQRQAALITTAIDLMHQISANESSYSLPSDIDKSSERMKQVLTSILGGEQFTKPSDQDGLMDEAFQIIQGINENVNMVALYADITYSQSKDGVGTETVGRHEAQHLMMPFLGDIKNFRKNGQLSNMQHTFASLMSLSIGANTLMGNSILQQKGFSKAKAWDMTTPGSVDQMVLTSSFTQEKFLGFYRANIQDTSKQVELIRQFKKINELMSDGTYYDLDLMRQPPANNKDGRKPRSIDNLNNDIVQYVEKLYSVGGPTIHSRFKERKVKEIQHKIFGADGNSLNTEEVTRFLMQRQDLVVMELQKLNDTYNANTDKALGSDATSSFIENMSNKDMFFSLPDLEFQAQDGMAVVRSKGSISTFLPAAEMMKKLGVQHADFIDPLISVYKDLVEVFAPGTIAYDAMQKVLASQNKGKAAVLTSTEATALQRVMQAANRMIPEAQKATTGARAQEAFGGKTKYKGFTSTGIGSFLVPFDSVALSTTKLAEAGYSNNERKTKALQLTLERRFSMNIFDDTISYLGSPHRDPGARNESLYSKMNDRENASNRIEEVVSNHIQKSIEQSEYEQEYQVKVLYDAQGNPIINPKTGKVKKSKATISSMGEDELERARARRRARKNKTITNSSTSNNPDLHLITPPSTGVKTSLDMERIAQVALTDKDTIIPRNSILNEAFAIELETQEFDDTIKSRVNWEELEDYIEPKKRITDANSSIEVNVIKNVDDSKFLAKLDNNLEKRYENALEIRTKLDQLETYYNSINKKENLTTQEAKFIEKYEAYNNSTRRSLADNQYIKPEDWEGPSTKGLSRREQIKENYKAARNSDQIEVNSLIQKTKDQIKSTSSDIKEIKIFAKGLKSERSNLLGSLISHTEPISRTIDEVRTQMDVNQDRIQPILNLIDQRNELTKRIKKERIINPNSKSLYLLQQERVDLDIVIKNSGLKDMFALSKHLAKKQRVLKKVHNDIWDPVRPDLRRLDAQIESSKEQLDYLYQTSKELGEQLRGQKVTLSTTKEGRRKRINKLTGSKALIKNFKELENLYYAGGVTQGKGIKGLLPAAVEDNSYSMTADEEIDFIAKSQIILDDPDSEISANRSFIQGNGVTTVKEGSTVSSIVLASSLQDVTNEILIAPGSALEAEQLRESTKLKREFRRKQRKLQRDKDAGKTLPTYSNKELYTTTDVKATYINNLIPGKSLELTSVTRELQGRVKKYYDLQIQALVQGISSSLISTYEEMIDVSLVTKLNVDSILALVNNGTPFQHNEVANKDVLEIYKLREELKSQLSKNKSLSAGDRYLYETNLLNIEGEITRLELGIGAQLGLSEDGKKVYRALTAEDKKNREITQEVFKNVTSVLNEASSDGSITTFSSLGASSFDIKGYELFDSKFSTSAKVSMGDLGTTTNIVQQLNDLGSNFNDKDIRRKAQVEMANKYLDDLKSQYTGLLNDLRTHSLERDESTVKDKAKEEAAYSEALKAHENILNSIETARQEISLGTYKEKEGFDRIFTSLNASLLINDQVSVQSAEVFRSPPPGSTDPRLHSYRIMNGVTALNRIASLTGAGGMSESRSSTSSYITAVGVVTYGGGDFDGDPYTAILHQSADTTSKIIENRMIINKNEVLARNLRAEIKSSTNQEDIQAKTIKLQEAEAKIISEKEKLENNQSLVEDQIKQGHENFNARARRQAAEYFGIDERILVEGKNLLGEVDYYKDPDTGVLTRGYGSKTYNADDVFSLMNTGHGLVEGLDQKGSTLFALYDTLDHLTGFRRNARVAMKNIKKAAASYKNFKTANAEAGTSQDNILSIYRELLATNNTLTDPQNVGNKYLADILVSKDSATAESLLQMFSSIEEEEAKYKAERALSEDLDLSLEQNAEYAKEFMHRFIGADLMAQIQKHETYSGFMTKGAGMQVSEGGMDVLLKTLGSAGGEVLGKTYNTIIGTTFKDSSLISFAQAVMKKDEDGNDSKLRTLLEQEINSKSTVEDPNAASYFEGLESALGKARGVQGFMKNIHQLLRDSIKLKSDQDMVGKLQEAATTYQEVTEKIRIHDRDSSGTAEEQKIRQSLLLERDQSINTLSSSLGDGPGLRALINLDYLIKSSKKTKGNQEPGLTNTQFSFMFLDSGTTKSAEFTSLLDRYNAEIEQQYNQLTGNPEVDAAKRSRLNRARIDEAGSTENYDKLVNQDGTKEGFLKLAQYKVSNQMVNLVAGYRMSESLKLTPDKNVSLNNSYIELLADTANSKNSRSSTISSTEIRQNIVDSYVVPDNPLEITDGNKAVQLRKVEAMGEYLGVDSSSLYKEQGLSSYKTEYNAALAEAADKAGLSVQDYIITYEQRYQKSREQASSLFGYSGGGLNTFTNLEGLRTDMAAMFKNGVEGANDSRIDKLMKVMDAESMQMMAQLVGSDKLMTSGFEVFNALFEGVLSNVMVDELDKVESEVFEATKKEAKAKNKYVTDEAIRNNPSFQQEVEKIKRRTIKRKSIQLMIGGGEGDRSTSVEGSVVRGITAAAMENDAVLDEYIKSQEGSLSSQQSEAMSQMAEHLLIKSSASQDQFNNLLDAIGGPVGLTDAEKANLSEEQQRQELFNRRKQKRLQTEQRLKEQQNIRFANAVRQQENDRKAFIDDNPYLRRGSMLSKVGNGLIGSLASNKGSSTLDILAPIALTALGSAISEGDVDATTMQDLGGATFTAAMYARTGFVDSASRKVYANRMGMAQMTGAVFKFKSGLQRYEGQGYEEGEKVLLAARDTLVRETISMAVNKAVAPALSQSIASRLGNNQAIAMDILGGKQHQAVQQISGNIGASLISAATSTLISGMFLKTVVPSPEKQMHADLQQFDVNGATVNSINRQIAYARAQQAAAEDVEVSESNGEPELSSYNVLTSSTYSADSSYDTMALYDEQELDIATDGSLRFDF